MRPAHCATRSLVVTSAPPIDTTHSGRAIVRGSLRSFGVAFVVVSGPRSLGAAICRHPPSVPIGRRSYCRPSLSPAATPHSLLSPLSLRRAPRKSGIAFRLLLFYRLAGRAYGLLGKNRYRPTGFCSFIALRVVPAGFWGKGTGRRVVTISDNTPSFSTASESYYDIHPFTLKYLFPCTVIAGGTPCVVPLS